VDLVVRPIFVVATIGDLRILHATSFCLAFPRSPASACLHLIVIRVGVDVATVVAAIVVTVNILIADLDAVFVAQVGICLKEVNRPVVIFIVRCDDPPCTPAPCRHVLTPRPFACPIRDAR